MDDRDISKKRLIGWVHDIESLEVSLIHSKQRTGRDVAENKQAGPQKGLC